MKPTSYQNERYKEAAVAYGREIARFASGYERHPARLRELQQEIHLALWQSFAGFNGQCSLRTWVYRVAHNVGASHIQRSLRTADRGALALDEATDIVDERVDMSAVDRRLDLQRVMALVHRLPPVDRQVMLLYLEDLDANAIAEVTGLSARNVATKVHRLKAVLAAQLHAGRNDA